jgi:hypothetical protein
MTQSASTWNQKTVKVLANQQSVPQWSDKYLPPISPPSRVIETHDLAASRAAFLSQRTECSPIIAALKEQLGR